MAKLVSQCHFKSPSIIAPALLKTFSNGVEFLLQRDWSGCLVQSQKRFLGIQDSFDFALLFGLASFFQKIKHLQYLVM